LTIRVGLFGCGWIQAVHAKAAQAYPGAELVAVANHREETARDFASKFGIPRITTDWEALAQDDGIDAGIVATPNVLHAPQAIALLEAGKHALVEKPMAMNVSECDRMVAASRTGGASLMIAHCWRFHPDVIAMRDRVSAGELGEIVKTRGYGVHSRWGPSGWFAQKELAGGGALIDMGVHAIDTVRFLLGDPEPIRVCATIGTRYGTYDVDDDDILLISWSNGTNSLVESGWWQHHKEGVEADTEVYGTKGYARIFPREVSEEFENASPEMYEAQMREFLSSIEEGRQPRPDGDDGRVVMRIAEEAYRSAASEQVTQRTV
jgi:predicted dehydrogenase